MSEMSNYLENEIFDHVLRNAAYTSPTTVYLALHTGDPGEAGGNELAVADGYARVAIAFGAPTDGSGSNSGLLSFTAAGGDWGSITHLGIHDASVAGNLLLYSAMTAAKTVDDGDTLEFAIAAVVAAFS